MKRNPTFVRSLTKTELANRISKEQYEVEVLRRVVAEFLSVWDIHEDVSWREDELRRAIARMRAAYKLTGRSRV